MLIIIYVLSLYRKSKHTCAYKEIIFTKSLSIQCTNNHNLHTNSQNLSFLSKHAPFRLQLLFKQWPIYPTPCPAPDWMHSMRRWSRSSRPSPVSHVFRGHDDSGTRSWRAYSSAPEIRPACSHPRHSNSWTPCRHTPMPVAGRVWRECVAGGPVCASRVPDAALAAAWADGNAYIAASRTWASVHPTWKLMLRTATAPCVQAKRMDDTGWLQVAALCPRRHWCRHICRRRGSVCSRC